MVNVRETSLNASVHVRAVEGLVYWPFYFYPGLRTRTRTWDWGGRGCILKLVNVIYMKMG